MKKVFIFGYYGFKNLGDEAILTSIIKTIKENDPSIEIWALSYNVHYTEAIHPIRGVSRNKIWDVIGAIRDADFVISGGGSLLQDVTSSRSLIYYLSLIGMAKLFNKPVIFFSNGFGPIKKSFNKYITRRIINKVDKIILRDNGSKLAMEEIGVNRPIEVTADATFVLDSVEHEKVTSILADEEIPTDKPLIGISVRPWDVGDHFIEIMAKFGDYIVDKGLEVIFIPMQTPKDIEISKKIMNRMKGKSHILENEYKPEEILGIMGSLEMLVGMRLHALIFAAIKGIPMLGLEYDPKISGFLESVKQKNIGKVEKLDILNLCIEFDKLWPNRQENAEKLINTVNEFKNRVNRNKDILKKMM